MNRARLLMLVFNQAGKGTYWRALGFAEALADRGYEVMLVAGGQGKEERRTHRPGLTELEIPEQIVLGSGYDPWAVIRRIRRLSPQDFDLIHAFESRPSNIFPALWLRRAGMPLVLDWCDWFGRGGSVEERPNWLLRTGLRPIETYFEEAFRRQADANTVINRVLQAKALALGVDEGRIHLLRNGANVTLFQPLDRWIARRRLRLSPKHWLIIYTGSIFKRDAELMAAAFEIIRARQPDARLVLAGYCQFPVERLVSEPASVIRTGPLSPKRLATFVAAADVAWLPLQNSPANQGRFPMKLCDFMATGRATVVTDVGDLGDYVRRKDVGVVAEDKPAALAATLLSLLADPAARERMERNARRVAETELAWPVMAGRLDTLYQALLNRRPLTANQRPVRGDESEVEDVGHSI